MSKQIRETIAYEAARIMADDGVNNLKSAKQKAMQRLGIQDKHLEPENSDVELALSRYQQLFMPEQQATLIDELRNTALNAMQMLADFSPRLVGPVLRGTATKNDCVSLHVFTDSPEQIHFHLGNHKIPFTVDEYQYQQNKRQQIICPVCRFWAGEVEISLAIFPHNGLRQAPLSPFDQKPMKRADTASVQKLSHV